MSVNVVFIKGSLAGLRFHIPEAGAVVGRSHSCGIRASESDVSGRHVQIVPAGNGAEMTVLSAHRAFVNGRRVPSGAKTGLKSGDHIRLGESLEFAFMVDNSAADGAGDSTSLVPEAGIAGGATRATAGTRATMATMATRATDLVGDDASTLDALGTSEAGEGRAPARPPRAGSPRPQGRDALVASASAASADTTATFPTDVPTGSTRLPGDGDDDGDETQMLKTQMVSREELEALGRMYEQRRKRRVFGKAAFFGFIFLLAMLGYVAVLSRKPENPLLWPRGKGARARLTVDNRGREGGRVQIVYPKTHETKIRQYWDKASGETNFVIKSRVGSKGDVPFLIQFSYYDDESALTNSCEASFKAWAERTFQGDLVNQGFLNDHTFIGSRNGLNQGIRSLSCEYSRFAGGEKFFGVASFFRNGRRCYVFRREVPDDEKVRAGKLLGRLRSFIGFDEDGKFSESHWEGMPSSALSSLGGLSGRDVILHCERLLEKESPSDWALVERELYGVLAAANRAGDDETQADALGVLRNLRRKKQTKWKELLAQRRQAANSADGVRGREIDARVRAVFDSEHDARHYLVIKKRWWE